MPLPALIATDLDGTLLRRDGSVSPRTLAALRRARAHGTRIVVVTARPPRYVDALAEATGLTGLAVCSNGALVYDLESRTVRDSRALAPPTARRVADALDTALPGIAFAVESGLRVWCEPAFAWRSSSDGGSEVVVPGRAQLWLREAPIVKLLAWSARLDVDVMHAAAAAAVPGLAEVTHSGGRGLLEISAPGVTKAGTLAALCEAAGIAPSGVLAFGDMPNDLTFLRWAGAAYAVANAHPAVLAAVPSHTAANEDDGVALVLERLYG
ncbi:Pyridoxal phosphate phosphatase YbhA [Streptomyces sp. RB5]|uniref:Pyridoxal phosphate phosphatase YbhA n=1 Tax=Streptomyces smaragdinus TaxID=2585196 RepID=A0A7K0CGE5_9ACTN|nr:HAD family hydrolase [Streptomyces smaragdinus]MQY12545.1 Pyridoxal phosphate phosphatase YbhA [Streptomyces smaragdinus]